jgi:hypothetical protein
MSTGNQDKLVNMGDGGKAAAESVEEMQSMFEAAKTEVERYAAERRECQELLLGEQWCRQRFETDGELIYLRDLQGEDDMELLQDNALADLLVSRVSQCVGAIPRFEAMPSTHEQADFTKAKAVTRMIPPLLYHLKSISHWRQILMACGYYNCAFGKVGWSRSLGPVKNGKPIGDVSLDVIPPFDMFVDPDAFRVAPVRTDEHDARWLFHRYTTTLGELELIAKAEHSAKTPTGGDQVWDGLPDEVVPYDGERDDSPDRRRNRPRTASRLKDGKLAPWSRVECLGFYAFPDEKHGRGRYALILPRNDWHIVNYRECLPHDAVVEGRELGGLFPFYMTWDEQVPGQLAGRSRTKAAAVHQRIKNRRLSEREDFLAKTLPYTPVDKRMGIDFKSVRNVPGMGIVLPFDGLIGDRLPETKYPPAVLNFVTASTEAEARAERGCENRMRIHSLANYPRRAMTATEAVEAMRYDADSLAQEAYLAEENCYLPHVKLVLEMVMRNYGDERTVSYVGDQNRTEVVRIMASGIDFKDIIIVGDPGSSMPRNRRLMKAEVLEAAKVGAFADPNPQMAEKKARWFMDLMGLHSALDMGGDQMDINNARAENADMLAGKDIPPPQLGDNDPIHLYGPLCHLDLRKDPAYRNLEPGKKAAVEKVLAAHCAIHQENIDQAADELRQKNPNLLNPMAEIMKIALGRVRPGAGDEGRGAGVAGPVAMAQPPGQPVDFVRPDGTRVYRETKGPKSSNQVG